MNKIIITAQAETLPQLNLPKMRFRVLFNLLTLLICLISLSLTVKAQAPYYEPSAKVYTPLTEQPGGPAGSYPLSGFDTVNLFNGGDKFFQKTMPQAS
jgi:hypothetical protein